MPLQPLPQLSPQPPRSRAGAGSGRAMRALAGVPQRLLLAGVHAYRLFLKPWLGNACRFEPSCSAYALQALERHGAAAGSYLATARLLRCHPWCAGGCDPVPDQAPALFSRLLANKTRP